MNTSQENKAPSSGSHSSTFPQTTAFASDLLHVLVSQDMLEKKEEEEEEKINCHKYLENISD